MEAIYDAVPYLTSLTMYVTIASNPLHSTPPSLPPSYSPQHTTLTSLLPHYLIYPPFLRFRSYFHNYQVPFFMSFSSPHTLAYLSRHILLSILTSHSFNPFLSFLCPPYNTFPKISPIFSLKWLHKLSHSFHSHLTSSIILSFFSYMYIPILSSPLSSPRSFPTHPLFFSSFQPQPLC